MGFIFGGDGGKAQAKAITETSEAQAAADREAARGAVLTQSSMLAQDRASRTAAELLSKPQGQVEVDLDSLDQNDAATRGKYSSLIRPSASAPAAGGGSPAPKPGGGGGGLGGLIGRRKAPRHGGLSI